MVAQLNVRLAIPDDLVDPFGRVGGAPGDDEDVLRVERSSVLEEVEGGDDDRHEERRDDGDRPVQRSRPESYRDRPEDIDHVAGILDRRAKADDRERTDQPERQNEVALDEVHNDRHDRREEHERREEAALVVHPAMRVAVDRGDHESQREREAHGDDDVYNLLRRQEDDTK